MLCPDAECIGTAAVEATLAKRIIAQASNQGEQLGFDFWDTLSGTRVVATTAGTSLVPWQAPTKEEVAKAFGDADAQRKGRERARTALDLGKLTGGREATAGVRAPTRPAKPMVIVPARHGNAFVVRRRRD